MQKKTVQKKIIQRRVIQQGNDTLTITLPKDWTRKYGVKAKDLLNLTPNDNVLEISAGESKKHETTEFCISSDNAKIINWVLGAFFKIGIDELTIYYPHQNSANAIIQAIRQKLSGYVIIKQDKNHCIIKSMSTDDERSLDSLIKRNFTILFSYTDNIYELINQKKYDELLELRYLHDNADQMIMLCERIILKSKYGSTAETVYKIALLENLELFGDVYKKICAYLSSESDKKIYLRKDCIYILKMINTLFREEEKLIYKYTTPACADFMEKLLACEKDLNKLIISSHKVELIFLFYLKEIISLMMNFIPTITMLNLNDHVIEQRPPF
ncbi:AbrB/MazE/SpoVT family DNA-binding domain-containing protein [Candidatus Woesearchaeota archaeon]|nr:AbrB/MazE/SpoVT family DNA-binding domain-containing protein [Candidatus Woesearchaeota archaeon]